ncbi:MAG: hypothetical protein ACRD0H_03165 [Actinomycetes bacterium]
MEVEVEVDVVVVVALCAPAGGGLVEVGAELVPVVLVDCELVVDCGPGTAELPCEGVEVTAAADGVVRVVVAVSLAVETAPTWLAWFAPDRCP